MTKKVQPIEIQCPLSYCGAAPGLACMDVVHQRGAFRTYTRDTVHRQRLVRTYVINHPESRFQDAWRD